MWHIILMVLEILGITLAVLAGLVLLLLISLLFVPFSYSAKGSGRLEEEQKGFQLLLRLNWLFLSCKGQISGMPSKKRWVIKVFFFPVYDSAKKPVRKKKKESEEPQWDTLEQSELQQEDSVHGNDLMPVEEEGIRAEDDAVCVKDADSCMENPARKDSSDRDQEPVHAQDSAGEEPGRNLISPEEPLEDERSEQAVPRQESDEKEGLWTKIKNRIKALYDRLMSIRENIQYTIRSICDKIKAILNNITYYIDLVRGEEFRQAFALSRKELFRVLSSIRPRKWKLDLEAGLGDPASTGQLFSFYGMLYPWIGKNILLHADFENKRLEANGFLKGRVTIMILLIAGLRLYLNKNLKRVIRMLKKEEI